MTQNSTVLSGIELDQFMDRVEVEHQEHGDEYLLAQLRAQPLKAVSLESIDRLHVLWVNAGDADASKAVLAEDGQALLDAASEDARNELKLNLLVYQLRLDNYLKDEQGLLQALDALQQLSNERLHFDIEQYRRYRIFDDLQHAPLEVALKAIEVRHTLALINPGRQALRAWDDADQYRRRAQVLAAHEQDEQAREAALCAIAALRTAGPDQDVDNDDWLWLGNALIEIVPLRLAMFEQPVVQAIADLPLPQRREWEVRLARLAARSLQAQGDLAGALKICEVATLDLDSSGGDSFIDFHLPWLLENGQIEEAGQRAFMEIYDIRRHMWPGTAYWVHDRLLDAEDQSAWWPLCVMRACDDQQVLERFISGLPLRDESTPSLGPLLDALHAARNDLEQIDNVFAQALEEARRRAPNHPWINRLLAVREREAGRIDANTELAMLREAVSAGDMQDNRSAFSLFSAHASVFGIIDALHQPLPLMASGMYYYQFAGHLENLVGEHVETLSNEEAEPAWALLRKVQRVAYEHGQARLEQCFASGRGHRFDACAHLYSMLCNNLAINYNCYNDQHMYDQALELHARGIAASPFAEHYHGILNNRIALDDNLGVVEAAEQLWHFAADHGYSRHDPEEYLFEVSRALFRLDREREILIWLERVLKLQEERDISDKDLEISALFARIKVAMHLSYNLPEAATSLWLRYAPHINERDEPSLVGCAGDVLKGLGRNEEAIAYYQRSILRSDPNNAVDQSNNEIFGQSIAELQAAEKPAGKAWWQIWK
ncbi:hypothetical protein [Pseudomonas rubra]|uniref:Tetratricopeptide repeat-containing protein n=1 Tax=Pseudomonas rubra TaxID=2942627 RepID=A0ABT5P3C2_9PSED|nr:hypothetical protein [Pseudomonas rubra]MDD1012777.1 hypothetical protein [Pseudomonas rubra]MDD1037062.1 hypothetical protein [Pseudomonas rubra]MDD1156968.1 hypothetical protein [Pseudomonas rubra]